MNPNHSSNDALQRRRRQAVARGVNQAHPVYATRALNATVWDTDGRAYIDFTGGIAALNTGHLHPRVVAAAQQQLARFTHTCFAVLPYETYVAVCERMNALAPGDFEKRTLLVTTGSEAVESAVKLARAHTRRVGLIAFEGAFHGRTLMTLALTGKIKPYAAGMGLMPGGVFRARFPIARQGISTDEAMASIERIFQADAAPEDVAAILVEPVQGEGGFHAAPADFLARLRALCDEYGIVLIADEIQSGAGRTGSFFAMEQTGVSADLTTFGKSVAGGFPLAGVTGRATIMDSVVPGGLGGTYAGTPLSCAVALAVLDAIEDERLLSRAKELGQQLQSRLRHMQSQLRLLSDVRGLGAMVAIEIGADAVPGEAPGNTPADLTARLVAESRAQGLLLLAGGPRGNVIRLLVPLTAPPGQVDEGLDILERCLTALG
ncbi:4-aminobutyrate aminotransferase, PLP-dependent [Thiomonas sp. X19]|nr:4-aminobutyrate aminotransferase, PLP-dependent [Thiomonas sp. X19]